MESISPSEQADPVSEALQGLNVRSTIFCLSELGAPWAFRVDGASVPKFHLVLEGSAWLTADSEDPMRVTTGDLVVLPHGQAHQIGDRPESPATALEQLLLDQPLDDRLRLRCGGPGPTTLLLCGGFALAEIGSDPTLKVLPHVVRLEAGTIEATGWLAPLLKLIHSEASNNEPGSRAVLAKIADVLLTQALRVWLVGAERAGLLMTAPLRDSAITTALQAIRERPAAPWSLDILARQARLSRTAFATRFRTLVGEPPMRYVTKARLSLAAGYLATSRISIYEIAVLAGYNDEASLSKAFRREFGQPPGEYRSASRRPPPITVAAVGASEDGSVAPS